MTEKNFETEILSDEERRYRRAHKDKPVDETKNPYLLSPKEFAGYYDDEDEEEEYIISDEERRYRAVHRDKPDDNSKNPCLLSHKRNSDVIDSDGYMSGAERNFRASHKDEFYSRRANPYIIPRGKTPEEIGQGIRRANENGYISSAERRYRARSTRAHANDELQRSNSLQQQSAHAYSSGSKHKSIRRKWRKVKHKVKHKIKHSTQKKVRSHKKLPMPVLVFSRFSKFFLLCAALSALSTYLFTRGFIAASDRSLMINLTVIVGIYILINLLLFKYKLHHTRSARKYYKSNYIAYSIFAGLNLIMCLLSHLNGFIQIIYTWLFSITKFIQYSHLEIPGFISACAFHLLMYFTIAILSRVRLRMGLINRH